MAEHHIRAAGWTAERQAAFLAALSATRSVTAAARTVGMSREGAYRLRERRDGALFAHLWDLTLAPAYTDTSEGHTPSLANGRLLRLLGNHYRRESGNFAAIGVRRPEPRAR